MKRSVSLVALAAGALMITGLVACMSDDAEDPQATGGAAGATNQGGNAQGGGAGNAGNAGAGGTSVCMEGMETTVKDIAMSVVPAKTAVKFSAVVTAGPVVTYSSEGKPCGYAIFVKDQAADFGTMIYAKTLANATKDANGKVVCPAVTDTGLVDNVAPGDVIEVKGGTTGSFGCAPDGGVTVPPQVQVNVYPDQKACVMTKTGTAAVAPVKVTDLAGIAAGKAEFQGLLVQIENVDAENWDTGGAIGPYGAIKIANSGGLEIHDTWYYKEKGQPQFCPSQHFNSITGIVHQSYCQWKIQVLDPATGFDPPSPQTTCQ